MEQATRYLIAADALLLLHVLFVVFVVASLPIIIVGHWMRLGWVRNPWFRWIHMSAICIVVVQSWLGIVCPLTTWEMHYRGLAGGAVYAGTFVSHWLDAILYYRAPPWVFAVMYSLFALLVFASWFWVRPRRFSKVSTGGAG